MSFIQGIIEEANFELIRSRIASILTDEFANQIALNQTALNAELAKPTPDPVIVAQLELNLSALPSKVWEERFRRPEPNEYSEEPLVNVIFTNSPLNELSSVSSQIGDCVYPIEVYAGSKAAENEDDLPGDQVASIKLQRCLAIIRAIIMNPNYQSLGFDYKTSPVGKVNANSLQIGQPDDGGDNAQNGIRGQINIQVKISETVEQITGGSLTLSETTFKLFDSEKGYYWTNESN